MIQTDKVEEKLCKSQVTVYICGMDVMSVDVDDICLQYIVCHLENYIY